MCPTLPAPANGSMMEFLLQEIFCDDGFTLEGRSRRICTTQNDVANWNERDNTICVRGMTTHNL